MKNTYFIKINTYVPNLIKNLKFKKNNLDVF